MAVGAVGVSWIGRVGGGCVGSHLKSTKNACDVRTRESPGTTPNEYTQSWGKVCYYLYSGHVQLKIAFRDKNQVLALYYLSSYILISIAPFTQKCIFLSKKLHDIEVRFTQHLRENFVLLRTYSTWRHTL